MIRQPPRSTRTDTHFPDTTLFRSPLRPEEARALAAGFAQANESRLTDCLERAAGNPLFLVQLLQNATESAMAVLPGSISSLVLARIDRLDALRSEERRVGNECVSTCRSRQSP